MKGGSELWVLPRPRHTRVASGHRRGEAPRKGMRDIP